MGSKLDRNRYQGYLWGMGLSGGYVEMVTEKFGLEASAGVGYSIMNHEVYNCSHCGSKIGKEHRTYFGPTKLAVSLIYKLN
ncbi:DUF3575 domain-containing protein [Pedobacter jamesrossensis]|uniref:DUF3575 domain-containing protein n=1 Tax=Pedobacter jamesrossensis TaxID=1908238 RepID=UPI00361D997D